MRVAGVDGCKRGWLVVRAEATNRLVLLDVAIEPTFDDLLVRTRDCTAVAVDIPIGLTGGPERTADQQARELLGQPRARSVFRAPCRPVLDETTDESTYGQVCVASRKYCLKQSGAPASMTQQSWRIMPKVREANLAMTPALQKTTAEVHPEVSFWALSQGHPMQHRKKSRPGKEERLRLLSDAFEDDLASVAVPRGAGREDLYDACAAAWTASRLAYGSAVRLAADPPIDGRGLRMEIVY